MLNSIYSIAAIEPCYGKEGGNSTRIYTTEGDVFEDRRRVKTVLHNICAYFGCNPVLLRKSYGELLGCSQSVPLPLSLNLVLVPLKMRLPQFEKDGSLGFVNICALKDIFEPEEKAGPEMNSCTVLLEGGRSVKVYYSKKCVKKRLVNGQAAKNYFSSRQGYGAEKGAELVQERAGRYPLDKLSLLSHIIYELFNDPQR